MEPLKIIPPMHPVEATIRILLSSVPYLIGAAVVRQPAGPDAVAADVGRNPWLFDRRLTSLDLPDDALPANRAVALDWPVPYQAEWVGVPPRLLISRLVFADRTVGVLLGTLITRDQLTPQTREAINFSCELIASAVAMDAPAMYVAPEPELRVPGIAATARPGLVPPAEARPVASAVTAPTGSAPVAPAPEGPAGIAATPAESASPDDPTAELLDAVGRAASGAADARGVARVLRDATNAVVAASAFTVSLFHQDRPGIAYRYKVIAVDAAASGLGSHPVDDGADCPAARSGDRWFAFERALTVGAERRRVAVVQLPVRDGGTPIGVVTLQVFREGDLAEGELRRIAAIVDATEPAFAAARAAGRFQRAAGAEFTLPPSPPAPTAAAPAPAGSPAATGTVPGETLATGAPIADTAPTIADAAPLTDAAPMTDAAPAEAIADAADALADAADALADAADGPASGDPASTPADAAAVETGTSDGMSRGASPTELPANGEAPGDAAADSDAPGDRNDPDTRGTDESVRSVA